MLPPMIRGLVVLALLAAAGAPGPTFAQPTVLYVPVLDIASGDTITVRFPGGTPERVRLIGINAPDRDSPAFFQSCFGEEAYIYLLRLLRGERVSLEFDEVERDGSGRLLAYVSARGLDLNVHLAEEGFVREAAVAPNLKHQQAIHDAIVTAQTRGNGLWARCQQELTLPVDAPATDDGGTVERPTVLEPAPAPRPSPGPLR